MWNQCAKVLELIPKTLNWLLSVIEPLIALAIGFLFLYATLCLVLGSYQKLAILSSVLTAVNDNWKAALALLIPLFYRPVRLVLEQLARR